ncbi:energy transducer TonB [Magnetospirillum sulfuroxidans]|uniref:Protein TonB n=1 Tax=Magnetospirillum sulfuroxidans TaxID=611300 RepID=A0ABS5IHA8_9PROT|nr:energy transducer TonB [Magnetospirillum sulfuroxidans]MBR9973770.1 energy transducer TonB [Magnetospirillum sulfuroxidans]
MNALRIPLSSATIGRSQPALVASVALHVAAALPLFLPMARPAAELTPPMVVELVMAAEEPVTAAPSAGIAAPTPAPAPPRSTSARVKSTPRPPVSKPVPAPPTTAASDGAAAPQDATPPPAEAGTADGAAATARGTDAGTGGGTTGKEGEVSAPAYALGTAQTPAPDYPWSARRRGVEGRVVLRLEVGADGRPTGVELVHGSGHDVLDQAAITTVWHWRLRPAMAGGVAVAGRVVVPIAFKLI